MADIKFLAKDSLPQWLDELSANAAVYAPHREGPAVVYRPYTKGQMPELGTRATESVKHVVFPRSEELFKFAYKADPEVVGKRDLKLEEAPEPEAAVVFGALSCDVRGFFAFDPVYNGCGTNGLAKDVYYLKRREKTAFIVLGCRGPLATCFCNWVGGGPACKDGADVHATRLDEGFVLEPITEKGKALMGSSLLKDATEAQAAAAVESQDKAEKAMVAAPAETATPEVIASRLLGRFEENDFWLEQSDGCISCGTCTYLCPTCYCFTITDESDGIQGTRLRSWDNCMSSLFTLEASGHNPRLNKAARLRNRVGHKFSYYPALHGGRFSCVGCGRCIKSCPSSVDIRQIVVNAITVAKEANNG